MPKASTRTPISNALGVRNVMMLLPMAETFNPMMHELRLHWFVARPCFDLLNPAARTPFAHSFLSEDLYYQADQQGSHFTLRRLGRRFQFARRIGKDRLFKPHGFWSLYMTRVANPEYRGIWKGLAPMRFVFDGDKQAPLLRIEPAFAAAMKVSLRAFPSCYLFPIGWVAGVVIAANGGVPLKECGDLTERLRNEEAFLWQGRSVRLGEVLDGLHEMIRSELVVARGSHNSTDAANPYLVASPLKFEGQRSFGGRTQVDAKQIATVVAGGLLPEGREPLITSDTYTLAMTVLNRGTFLMAQSPEREANVPGCSSSNLKNALLITMLMQKFHQNSRGHRNPIVMAMRNEVGETFRQLENFWNKPHFLKICRTHAGIAKMLEEQVTPAQVTIYNFNQSVFENTAIGSQPQLVYGSDAGGDSQGLNPQNSRKGVEMSNFTFTNNQMTNNLIGDYGTFNQNVQNMSIEQLGSDLKRAQTRANKEASTDAEKADAKNISDAAEEAVKGNRGKVAEYLYKVGKWGWNILKEVGSAIAVESLKQAAGI